MISVMFHAGGVEETVSSDFDLDAAMRREYAGACVRLCKELEVAGLLKVTDRIKSGDYTKQFLILTFPHE